MALGILGLNSVLNISLAIHSILQAADKVKSFNVESDVRVLVTANVLNVPSCTVVGLVADKPIVYNEPIGSIFIVWLKLECLIKQLDSLFINNCFVIWINIFCSL